MDSGEYCGSDDHVLWKYLESGARSPHAKASVIQESRSFFGFTHFL